MARQPHLILTEVDRARIAEAISQAEQKTAGEIFCLIAQSSSDYRLVPVAWAAMAALLVPAPLIYLTTWPAPAIYGLQLALFLVLAWVLSWPAIRFAIVPRRVKRERCHTEALRQFRSFGLERTADRTGVLIFVSVAERHAEVVADAGICAKVGPDMWERAVDEMIAAIRAGRPADGFVEAIRLAGLVLAEHVPPTGANADELPNRVVEIGEV
jgi:putative membrane protein